MDDPAAVTVLDSFSVTMGQGLVAVAAAEAAADGASMDRVVARGGVHPGAPDRLRRHRHPREPAPGGQDRRRRRRPGDPAVHQARHRGARRRGGAGVEAAHPGQIAQVLGAESALGRALGTAGGGRTHRLPTSTSSSALVDDVRSTKPVVVGEIGPVIGTHAGPGTIGVAWVTRAPLKTLPVGRRTGVRGDGVEGREGGRGSSLSGRARSCARFTASSCRALPACPALGQGWDGRGLGRPRRGPQPARRHQDAAGPSGRGSLPSRTLSPGGRYGGPPRPPRDRRHIRCRCRGPGRGWGRPGVAVVRGLAPGRAHQAGHALA